MTILENGNTFVPTQKFETELSLIDSINMNSNFFNNGDKNNLNLHFALNESGHVKPSHITWSSEESNSGNQISIQVVDNGYLVKCGKINKVCTSHYEMEDIIKDMCVKNVTYQTEYDPELHIFSNLEEKINEIAEQLANK